MKQSTIKTTDGFTQRLLLLSLHSKKTQNPPNLPPSPHSWITGRCSSGPPSSPYLALHTAARHFKLESDNSHHPRVLRAPEPPEWNGCPYFLPRPLGPTPAPPRRLWPLLPPHLRPRLYFSDTPVGLRHSLPTGLCSNVT